MGVECKQVRNELVKFMDNEVSDETVKAIQIHLDSCAECSRELESLQSAVDMCRYWRDISPSRDWETELRRKQAKAQREPMTELEILRSAVIGLSRRVQELEQSQPVLPPILESEIMTVDELARYLRLSADQIHDIIDQLPRFHIGYEYRFRRESIDQWIRSLEQRPYPQEHLWGDWSAGEE
jgi:excisionase family DNA binding protein